MKYDIKMGCGHTDTVELFGKNAEREKKIKYFEKYGLCRECYMEKLKNERMAEGLKLVEMTYYEYKNNYSECKTEPGSYDKERKTIKVWIKEA